VTWSDSERDPWSTTAPEFGGSRLDANKVKGVFSRHFLGFLLLFFPSASLSSLI
jgi:hypothetical protein